MNIAVVGSRDFTDYNLLSDTLNEEDITLIISGGASGADSLAEEYAHEHKIPLEVHRPDWDHYGKRAGYVRNKEIVSRSDKVIAFWDGKSQGTKHSIEIAKYQKKPVRVVAV